MKLYPISYRSTGNKKGMIVVECLKCKSTNVELVDSKKLAGKWFLFGVVLFPLFFIFWPLAILTLFMKNVYECKDCKKTFAVKPDKTVKG
jgi:hypothetical protein